MDEKLPTGRLAALDLQHVLVMYAGAVAVPLIVGRALKLSPEQVALLISADLFCCGLVTLIQSLGFGRWFGVRLPVMMGVTFAAVGPMVAMANANGGVEGARAIFGAIIGAGIISILIAPIMSRLLRYFPPVVTGTITAIIGISLMRVGVGWALGGPANLAQSVDVPKLVAMVDAAKATAEAASDLLMILTMTLVMIVVMIESTGMFLALGDITGKKISQTELSAGLRTDGLGTLIGGIFNTFPYTSFSQNVGLVGVTGVKSRWVCVAGGVIMIVLGMLPKMAALVESVPTFVLGGAGLVMFGMVAATGIRTLSNVDFKGNASNLYIVAISIGFGLVPLVAPRWTQQMAHGLHPLLESGILLTSIAAVVLNLYFNGSRSDTRDAVEASKSFTGGH